MFTDSKITEAADSQLIGNLTPQVPKHSGYVGVSYRLSPFTLLVDLQHHSKQFDDDQNRFALVSFTQVDAQLSYDISNALQLGVGAHNLFDTEIQIARTPELSVGQPRVVFVTLKVLP